MEKTPNYIAMLHARNGRPAPESRRKVWGIELGTVWVPYFMATNAITLTDIPSESLGAPLRLRTDKDGSVKFTTSGRPSLKVADELREGIRTVQENFIASLVRFTATVQLEDEEAYKGQVSVAQVAGKPIMEHMVATVEEALAVQAQAAEVQATPKPKARKGPVAVAA